MPPLYQTKVPLRTTTLGEVRQCERFYHHHYLDLNAKHNEVRCRWKGNGWSSSIFTDQQSNTNGKAREQHRHRGLRPFLSLQLPVPQQQGIQHPLLACGHWHTCGTHKYTHTKQHVAENSNTLLPPGRVSLCIYPWLATFKSSNNCPNRAICLRGKNLGSNFPEFLLFQ